MKLYHLLAGAGVLAFATGAAMAEQPPTPPGHAVSEAARQGGGAAMADVARENAPGTAVSADAREEHAPPEGKGLEDNPGLTHANEVLADLPPASVPATRPTLPPTAVATLPTPPARPALPPVPRRPGGP